MLDHRAGRVGGAPICTLKLTGLSLPAVLLQKGKELDESNEKWGLKRGWMRDSYYNFDF